MAIQHHIGAQRNIFLPGSKPSTCISFYMHTFFFLPDIPLHSVPLPFSPFFHLPPFLSFPSFLLLSISFSFLPSSFLGNLSISAIFLLPCYFVFLALYHIKKVLYSKKLIHLKYFHLFPLYYSAVFSVL